MEHRDDKLKLQIAEELGLLDKVMHFGWKSLSAKETGRIGGILSRKIHTPPYEGKNKDTVANVQGNGPRL